MQARPTQPTNVPEIKQDNSPHFKWNGVSYAQNSTPQADRNTAALKIFGLIKGQNGLDIGCGNAKTTRQIAEAVFPGTVIGIDNAESMVQKAVEESASVTNLKIVKGDAASFKFFQPFDFITSFFCLQWVSADLLPNALKNIYSHLKENGRVCILLPYYDFPHEVIKGVAFSEKWQAHFNGFKEAQTFFPEAFYQDIFQNIGFQQINITRVESNHPLTDAEFINYTRQWCGCYPWLKDEKLQNDFIQDILARLATEKHIDGKLDMVQKSIRIIANKPVFDLPNNVQNLQPMKAKL